MSTIDPLARRHLRRGWLLLLVFLSLGIALEAMHGFKVGWYLDVSNETRRLMFRLAHAHGVLLALVHIAFGVTIYVDGGGAWAPKASRLLSAAGLLLPGGFFLGGLVVHEADPWIGILLVPVGAVALFCAVGLTAFRWGRSGT